MFQLFKKRKDALIVLLTSSDCKRTRRAYESIKNSKKTINVDIEIIVNSLNKNHFHNIKNEFKNEKINIIETESNGGCGKGKNSVLEHFKNHKTNYDYLMQFDADDFLYPSAFEQYEKMLSKGPDILGLQASDTLIQESDERATKFFQESKENGNEFLHYITDNYFLHSWNEKEFNINKLFPKNVFKNVSEQYPPDRTIFLSEKILKTEKDLWVPEDIQKYTDYIFSVRLFERALNNNYSYAHFSTSYCYVYDRTNENAVSSTYEEFNQTRDFFNKKFPELIKDSVDKCNYKIDFGIVPHFEIGKPHNFSHQDKIEFIKNNLIK